MTKRFKIIVLVSGIDFPSVIGKRSSIPSWHVCSSNSCNPKRNLTWCFAFIKFAFAPASDGTVFVPYGQVGFVFEPKEDIKKEYLSKFQHTQSTGVKTQPKFEG